MAAEKSILPEEIAKLWQFFVCYYTPYVNQGWSEFSFYMALILVLRGFGVPKRYSRLNQCCGSVFARGLNILARSETVLNLKTRFWSRTEMATVPKFVFVSVSSYWLLNKKCDNVKIVRVLAATVDGCENKNYSINKMTCRVGSGSDTFWKAGSGSERNYSK
jgi:hypothetical protein